MVDVSVQILQCDLHPPKHHVIVYDIKTFWCKDKRLIGNEGEKLKPISLPVLPLSDYYSFVKKGGELSVFIEVSFCHKDNVGNPTKFDKFVGLAVTTLDSQIANPNLNPKWQLLPIENIINNSTKGKLYITTTALLLGSHVNDRGNPKENTSAYFSASTRSNPASVCPPNLVDHISVGFFNDNDFFSDSNKNSVFEKSNKSDSQGLSSVVDKSPDYLKARDEKRPECLLLQYAPPRKPDPIVAHNMSTSPDFPFKIPAVQEDEKQKQRQRKRAIESSKNNCPESPPLFAYTPKTPHVKKNHSEESGDTGASPYINNIKDDRGQATSQKSRDEIGEILSALNESFDKTLGHKVEQIKENKLAKDLLNERKSFNQKVFHQPPTNDHQPLKNICFPKKNGNLTRKESSKPPKPKPASCTVVHSSNVPGMTIKKYVPPNPVRLENEDHSHHNVDKHTTRIMSSRIAANFS